MLIFLTDWKVHWVLREIVFEYWLFMDYFLFLGLKHNFRSVLVLLLHKVLKKAVWHKVELVGLKLGYFFCGVALFQDPYFASGIGFVDASVHLAIGVQEKVLVYKLALDWLLAILLELIVFSCLCEGVFIDLVAEIAVVLLFSWDWGSHTLNQISLTL